MRALATLFGIFFSLANVASAQQTNWQVGEVGAQAHFSFAWNDKQGLPHSLKFALPLTDLARGETEFTEFDQNAANAYAFEQVKKALAKLQAGGVDIKAVPTFSGYNIEGTLPPDMSMDSIMADLQKIRDAALNTYIAEKFYSRMDSTNIMPDHKRIAKRYASALAPFTQAVAAQTPGLSVRERTDWLLHFLQTIPYDTLLNRYSSNGAGFQTPYGLFRRNRGDCDTKAVALLATLRGLYPTLPLTMVYVPEHAFVGIGIPQGPNDFALNLGGRTFVLADPTGPRLLKTGQVDEQALGALTQGKFSFQEVPF